MTAAIESEEIRLTVPAQPDYVQVVRIAVRVVAGRAGCTDDARSRLQAAAGAAFFELIDRAAPTATIVTALTTEPERMVVALAADPPAAPLDPSSIDGLADGHLMAADGGGVQLWVGI